MRPLINKPDRRGMELCAYGQSDEVSILTLAASTNGTIAVPDGAKFAVFQKIGTAEPLYAKMVIGSDGAFTGLPGDGNGQELMVDPYKRDLTIGDRLGDDEPAPDNIHLICSEICTVVINFYGY